MVSPAFASSSTMSIRGFGARTAAILGASCEEPAKIACHLRRVAQPVLEETAVGRRGEDVAALGRVHPPPAPAAARAHQRLAIPSLSRHIVESPPCARDLVACPPRGREPRLHTRHA